jgi:hypothetical protein
VGVQNKQRFWKRFSALLVEAGPVFEFGDWDLVRDASAQGTFDEWSASIEAGAASEPVRSHLTEGTSLCFRVRSERASLSFLRPAFGLA